MAKETAVFIDSVGWIALVHRGDELHHKTVQTYRGLGSVRRITTDAVLIDAAMPSANRRCALWRRR